MHVKNAIVLLFAASAISMPLESVHNSGHGAIGLERRDISHSETTEEKRELIG
uniref:Effector protein n=1 Tax=Fusarium oxysporum f. sp. apii TaxID=224912 RepID=A0A866WMJ9_FUSOX|nr:effector protein [Fusarium oxysporum f. sp. apii]